MFIKIYLDDLSKRNKRRSKNDTDGRTFRCSICSKSYLSYPALYTHIKTKHNTNGQSSGRGRGRPKKDTGDSFNPLKSLYNPATIDYFKSPDKIGETENIRECCEQIFNEMCTSEVTLGNEVVSRKYSYMDDHPFFKRIMECSAFLKTLDGETSKCDEIFADYLVKSAKLIKQEFFVRLVKFVYLFREALNTMNKEKVKNDEGEFTEVTNAEDAPDISNEFVTEFLDCEQQKYGFNKEDAIDLTQNFCQWLYDNNFTCSKLSLINNSY